MEFLLKKTQTLINSLIVVTLLSIITLIIPKYQSPIYGITDPRIVSNNKFGIHVISASENEASDAANLVNSTGGDWGYITFLIESKDRDVNKWQQFFDQLRERHLIPIVRLTTKPINSHWEKPYEKEYEAWADFLNNLNWPIKNRYIIIYNEPNHSKEWGNQIDPVSYAQVLNNTIEALKAKSPDFFVMNAGFDASAPQEPPNFYDEERFLIEMNRTVPGIFNKLDGWVSHSYPNPGFIGSPNAQGRGTVRTFEWELQVLRQLGVRKNLPVFITETGWRHSEGASQNLSLPSPETVAEYFKTAFSSAWSSNQIVAVTPFLLNYQSSPFDHFSFKKLGSDEYHPHFLTLQQINKNTGSPVQVNKADLITGEIYASLVAGESYKISLTFKNTGQSIWGDPSTSSRQVKLVPKTGGLQLGIVPISLPAGVRIRPGQDYTFEFNIKAPQGGVFQTELNLLIDNKEFNNKGFKFITEVKSPVILKIKAALRWKEIFEGKYLLSVIGPINHTAEVVDLDKTGQSREVETRYLLPGYSFDFTLQKPLYQPKIINQKVESGVNTLDFGVLNPDFMQVIINPRGFWDLLPFSN